MKYVVTSLNLDCLIFFFTFNLSVIHSPIFQVMYGDEMIDLTERYPCLVSVSERAK